MDGENIALVYGSFHEGNCVRDIQAIHQAFPKILQIAGLQVMNPVEGNMFNFDSLKDMKVLVICTSSKLGFPPPNFQAFAYQLLLAANSNPGCLSHLKFAVCGNGQEMYEDTYMNMPRYMDLLLEKCGAKRFYARGEFGEPHAALGTEKCECKDWAEGVWKALADTLVDGEETRWSPISWRALWDKKASEIHDEVTEWDMKQLEKQLAKAEMKPPTPSTFAKL